MKVCLIGYGRAGTLHLERWVLLGYDMVIVDGGVSNAYEGGFPIYSQIDELPSHIIHEIDIWDVCLPTSLHFLCILNILKHNPKANILVEKPLCDIDQIETFKRHIQRKEGNSNFKIIVNAPYSFSEPINKNIKLIRNKYSENDIVRLYIEFSKNRTADEKKGRFIDIKSGALGYEWFHMLSILDLFLQKNEMKEYLNSSLNSHPFSFTLNSNGLPDNIEEKITLSSRKEVILYTSMQGDIKYPLNYFHPESALPSYLSNQAHIKCIGYGDDRKYRAVHLILKDACISILLGYTGYDQKDHLVLYRSKNSFEIFPVFQDHMFDSIKNSLDYFKRDFKGKNHSLIKALNFESKILKITRFISKTTSKKRRFENDNSLQTKKLSGQLLDIYPSA